MVSLFNAGIVMAIVIIGVGITSYRIGLRRGAEALVEILIEEGILTDDEK